MRSNNLDLEDQAAIAITLKVTKLLHQTTEP